MEKSHSLVTNPDKHRYLKIDTYPYIFEIFIGKDVGDFKPKYEQIDNLKIGDKIHIYYDELIDTRLEKINRLAQFIDKDGVSFFERGTSDVTMGIFAIFLAIINVFIGYVVFQKKRHRNKN